MTTIIPKSNAKLRGMQFTRIIRRNEAHWSFHTNGAWSRACVGGGMYSPRLRSTMRGRSYP